AVPGLTSLLRPEPRSFPAFSQISRFSSVPEFTVPSRSARRMTSIRLKESRIKWFDRGRCSDPKENETMYQHGSNIPMGSEIGLGPPSSTWEAQAGAARTEAAALNALLSELLDRWYSGDQPQLWANVKAFLN